MFRVNQPFYNGQFRGHLIIAFNSLRISLK